MSTSMTNRVLFVLLGLAGLGLLVCGCLPTENTAPPMKKPTPVTAPMPDLSQPPPAPPDLSQAPDMAEAPPDMTCGGMQFQLQRIPPNVMLVLDRSGSMGNSIDGTSTTSKWMDLKSALTNLVTNYDAEVRFGVDLFAGDNDCAAGPVSLMPADMNGANVMAKVNAASPGGNTPTAATLAAVLASGAVTDATRDNVVVLATDGEPNCSDTDVTSKVAALYAAKVPTYVIGVGTGTAADPTQLNAWAVAGHTDLPGTTKYFQTNSPTDLKNAFDTIAGGIVSCSFKMSAPVPDPTQVYVFENGTSVPNDPANGFTYDATGPTVTLNGSACAALKANPKNSVQVTYGCPVPPPVS
jgi:hypothetical protein